MKLWVDDERPAPDDTWQVATNADEALDALLDAQSAEEPVEWLSLDYMLGYHSTDETGEDVVGRMSAALSAWPERITAHSSSWSGRELVLEAARRYAPEGTAVEPYQASRSTGGDS